ncbi:hypothetical protein OBK23_09055 [Empedobacter falsenii]|uniref:hypothetical protein n=1 Tax=Empedobacter falsenii TaxID=343874 RepID=UPI003A8027A4
MTKKVLITTMTVLALFSCKDINKKNHNDSNENFVTKNESTVYPRKQFISGKLVLGHEVQEFTPCGSNKSFWIIDNTGILQSKYDSINKMVRKPYSKVYAEIEIVDKGKSNEGFASDYESVYEVINIKNIRKLTNKDCNSTTD